MKAAGRHLLPVPLALVSMLGLGIFEVHQQDCARAEGPGARPVTEIPRRLLG